MPYTTLSEQIRRLANPQRSDAVVKPFRAAVRDGELEAADLPSRFTLPKQFRQRGSDETRSRDVWDMVMEQTPEVDAWFTRVNEEVANTRGRTPKVQITVENIEAGAVNFKALAEETRRKMQASFEKGQHLGQSRGKAKAKAKPTRGRTAKAKK